MDSEEGQEAPQEAPLEEARPRKRRFPGRRRACPVCVSGMKFVDYKDVGFLRRFISDRARMEPRRKAGACAKHQRAIARAIKRARHVALLPYTVEHIRITGNSYR
ncbi:MAG TPA: 30S ribosomal protein S18 [Dehalococcoidia bacterium]|nr:30S ribosomal protein S18 [Dehalococcoidia bacterium]